MANTTENKIYYFAGFVLDPLKRTLLRDGDQIALNSKTFELLLTLVEHRGSVLSKNELLEKVWENQFVEENNLTVHISALRKALGEKKNENRFIVTVPGRGYSFVADLAEQDKDAEIIVENHTYSRIVIEEESGNSSDFRNGNQSEEEAIPAARRIEKTASKKKLDFKTGTVLFLGSTTIFLSFLAVWYLGNNYLTRLQPTNSAIIKLSRLTGSGKILNVAASPDGKFVIFAQKEAEGQSLWLRQIETGSQTRILESKPVDYIGLSITPDGNYLYSTTFEANKADPVVSKLPILGGAAQVLPFWTCIAVSFSPDGKQIAFNQPRSAFKETHLLTANADGSDLKILKRLPEANGSFPNYKNNSVAWSPGGDEIATIIEETGENGRTARLVGYDPINGGERSLTDKRWAFVWHLTWTADGKNLAVVGRDGDATASQIWLVSRDTGEARRITNDLSDYSFIVSPRNSEGIFAVQRNVTSALQVAEFDENKNALEPRTILTESREFNNLAWTPAGEIIYTSAASGKSEIWRVKADGKDPKPLTADARVFFGASVSPDGERIAFNSRRENGASIWVADKDGKNVWQLTSGKEDISPRFAGNDQIVFQNGLNNKNITLWRVGLDGESAVQLTNGHATHPVVSPDGARVAYYFMDVGNANEKVWRIGLISTATGAFEGKLSFPKFVTERRMAWHPSGAFLTQIFYTGDNINLLLLPVNGEQWRTIENLGNGEVGSIAWSPDGRLFAYSRLTETRDIVALQIVP